jgi:hypothetical protein
VLKPGNASLSDITVSPESMPQESVFDTFKVASAVEPVLLDVHSVFKGRSAETTRSYFADTSVEKIQKAYLDYYASRYSKIKVEKPLRYQDFADENRFEVWEEYKIPGFWTRKTPKDVWKAIFSPHIVSDEIGDPPSPQRSSPYHANYPTDISEDIEVQMFDNWNVDPSTDDRTTAYFTFTDHPSCDKNIVHFRYHYKTLVPDILPENISDYHDEIKKLRDNLDYDLTYRPKTEAVPPVPEPFRANWPVFGMAGVVLGAVCYLAFRIFMLRLPYPPPPVPPDIAAYEGLGGWLILITIGLVLRVGMYAKTLCTDYGAAWDAGRWNLLTVPGAASYDPLWAPTLLFELASMIFFLIFSILALVLLIQKRTIFPKIMITVLLLALAFKVADAALASQIPLVVKSQGGSDPDLFRVLVQAVIWVPYLLYSKRVRATFRR